MKIAIDGTAGSGKGTLSKRLGKKLNIPYLDTGILYRKVAFEYLKKFDNKLSFNSKLNKKEILNLVEEINFEVLKVSELRKDYVGIFASQIAKISQLRKKLKIIQVDFAKKMVELKGGCILDGRDIGTSIIPDAEIKFFIVASIKTRVERRLKEFKFDKLPKKEQEKLYKDIFQKIKIRDENDYNRDVSPLKMAIDAIKIDTSQMTPKEVEMIAIKHINEKKSKK